MAAQAEETKGIQVTTGRDANVNRYVTIFSHFLLRMVDNKRNVVSLTRIRVRGGLLTYFEHGL